MQQTNKLEKIQLEAGRIVTGTTKLVSIGKLYTELGWVKLADRCKFHKLQQFYKMDHNLAPGYLCDLLPPHVGDTSNYPLRNADNYTQVHASTAVYGSSFLPSTIREWNKLPIDHRNVETLSAFKTSLINRNIKIPKYFLYGNRLEQKMHTRLRTECSALNYYLYRRNLIPSPNCVCGAIENNNHYLLTCPRYNDIRDEMINTVLRYTNVTAETLLQGNSNLSHNINQEIFKVVHKYIRQSKRFMS